MNQSEMRNMLANRTSTIGPTQMELNNPNDISDARLDYEEEKADPFESSQI